MHAYLLALEIEPVEVNKVYVALPLHCTVIPWFRSNQPPAAVVKAVSDIIAQYAPIELVSGEADSFGHEGDVPVNLIANPGKLKRLHMDLHTKLQQALPLEYVVSDWIGEGYVPHVTRQRSGRFEKGRKFVARKLYVTEALLPDELQQKKIISKLFLKGNQ